ncbi:MAG: class I SAM-dependent methyltransferase [Bacteroidetes bacterium]|nr:class I SAM-dependent methyltransferase [Bacteroidota bacterium]
MKDIIVPFFFMPFKLKVIKSENKNKTINYLDVGCGNHSAKVTKKWFPQWHYYGVDRENYMTDTQDIANMEQYYKIDLSKDSLDIIPDNFFNVVVMAHVIEHLPNGLEVINQLINKVTKGGQIYIEFPSERSLSLPSMHGTLNFCDDLTHIRVYSVIELANVLLSNNFRIIRAGTRRDKFLILTFPLRLALKFLINRKIGGGDFWDVLGFASYIYASKQ